MNEKKLVIFEGIPGGGKTSVILELQKSMSHQFSFIPEIVREFDPITEQSIDSVLENDKEKYKQARLSELPVVMDRSFISSLNWDYVLRKRKKHNRYDTKSNRINEMLFRNELWPANYYFFFNITPSESVSRKNLPIDDSLAWSTEDSLAIAISHYHEYFESQEEHSKLIVINAEEAFNTVLSTVVNLLELVLEGKL